MTALFWPPRAVARMAAWVRGLDCLLVARGRLSMGFLVLAVGGMVWEWRARVAATRSRAWAPAPQSPMPARGAVVVVWARALPKTCLRALASALSQWGMP